MNFDFNFVSTGSGGSSSSATNSPSMLDNYEQRAANTFDSLMSGSIVNESTLNIDSIANEKSEDMSQAGRYTLINNMQNLYMQQPSHQNNNHKQYTSKSQQLASANNLTSAGSNQFSNGSESKGRFSTDYLNSLNKFQSVLMAPTSPAVKVNEDTLTYLNQGQNYELKLSRHLTAPSKAVAIQQPLSQGSSQGGHYMEDIKPLLVDSKAVLCRTQDTFKDILTEGSTASTLNQLVCDTEADKMLFCSGGGPELNEEASLSGLTGTGSDPVYLSVIRLCFWDRKLQEIEHEEIKEWEKEYNNIRMLEIDNSSSFGTIDVRLSDMFTNAAEVLWYGKTGASIFLRCNCTSTAFAPHKHGGEKGIHMRFQIDTFELDNNNNNNGIGLSALGSNTQPGTNSSSVAQSPMSDLSPLGCQPQQQQMQQKSVKQDFELDYVSQLKVKSEYGTQYWRHMCSSFCRIQLFRLKGAQRKLKTDKLKVERLNPSDLKKRYQPSNKVTLLYNTHYDPLFSLMPFSRYMDMAGSYSSGLSMPLDNNSLDQCLGGFISAGDKPNGIKPYYLNTLSSSGSTSSLSSSSSSVGSASSSASMLLYGTSQYNNQPFIPHQQQQNLLTNNLLSVNSPDPVTYYIEPNNNNISTNSSNNTGSYFAKDQTKDAEQVKNNSANGLVSGSDVLLGNSNQTDLNSSFCEELLNSNPLKRTSSSNSMNNSNGPSYCAASGNASNGSGFCYKSSKVQKTTNGNTCQTVAMATTYSNMGTQQQQHQQQQQVMGASANNTPINNRYSVSSNSISLPSSPIASAVSNNQNDNLALATLTTGLASDCSNKYVQEWLVANCFAHLLDTFAHYTSNDILRLTKEDLVSLCGPPDGIRCFNVAHNIQIKPRLTLFVTFQRQSYFSAVFIADWKNQFLSYKILELYNSFLENVHSDETFEQTKKTDMFTLSDNYLCNDSPYDFEVFLRLKGVLVRATVELLNTLEDQSKYLVELEKTTETTKSKQMVKIIMEPID